MEPTNITTTETNIAPAATVETSAAAGATAPVPSKPKRNRKPAAKDTAPVEQKSAPVTSAEPDLTEGTRDYKAMLRFVKKYGRNAVQSALRSAASEASGRQVFEDNDIITLNHDANPHRKGTKNYKRWNKYRNGMTVAESKKAGIERANVRYLASIGYVTVNHPSAE